MVKNRIWLIVILMSTALLGIILVQVYWIQNTISQKEEVFRYHVNEALNKVADKVETNIAASVLSSHMSLFFSDSTYWGHEGDSLSVYSGIMSDSMIAGVIKSSKVGSSYYSSDIAALNPYKDAFSPMPGIGDRPTMILEPLEYHGEVSSSSDNGLISEILKDIDRQLLINSQRIKKAMEQIMFQMVQRGIQPEQTIDTVFLKNTSVNARKNYKK